MTAKTLIFNFDGTGSEPRDAEQFSSAHFKEDASITNILKLHLLFGGALNNEPHTPFANQLSFYYQGIGTQGSRFKRLLNQSFAPRGDDVASILNRAINDFNSYYQVGDRVLLTGFSRGAALARRFAKCLEPLLSTDVYLCVFDTVASIGLSKVTKATRGAEHVIFENYTLATNITTALHCVALDEKRRAFEPTLINHAPHVHEIWFAGAHSDVGGGYYRDGLADICLRYALEWLIEQPLQLHLLTSAQIDYSILLPSEHNALIAQDDMTITPDPLALSHQQNYFWFNPLFKLIDRECCVLVDNEQSDLPPLVHQSVAERINRLTSYRPESLKSLKYQVLYSDDTSLTFTGLSPHIAFDKQHMTLLAQAESKDIMVYAAEPYNHTGLMLEQGGTYRFTPYPEQVWYDDGVSCGPQGWHRDNVQLGVKEIPMALLEPFRRLPHAQWFALIGAIDNNDDNLFEIASGADIKITRSGEFCPFANDLKRFYGANTGRIKVKVTRLG
ncbi:MAG: phospholipase effector Tle1 domain-containing protein [Pseudoalteromonas prydzensis]|uniref:phospholipase effector Tle1 domain-containing protein n=1 Tax=Pseudoalteromonas prydzensis TaxID=182141 RepID=UPI003F9ABE9D